MSTPSYPRDVRLVLLSFGLVFLGMMFFLPEVPQKPPEVTPVVCNR